MNYVFQKTTNNASKTLDSSNITVNGSDLATTINKILQDNVTDSSNFAGCATLAGSNVFTSTNTMPALTIPSSMAVSSTAISLSKLPRLASTLTPSDPKDLATKQYTDDAGGTITTNLLASNNNWTGINTFVDANYTNAFRVGSSLTFSPSNLVFAKIPITDIDRSSEITDDKQFITKKYLDLAKTGLVTLGNNYTGANSFTSLTVPNTCSLTQANGASFSVIPKTDIDRTAEMTDDKHFVSKKFVQNQLDNMLQFGINQWGGTNIYYDQLSINPAGNFDISSCCNFSSANGAEFYTIPKTGTDLSATITDDKQFITRGYLKKVVPSTTYNTKAIIGEQVYWRVLQGGGTTSYKLYPPKPQTDGYIMYLNFPSTAGSNNLICHNALLNFDYYSQQNNALTGFTSNGDGSYTTATAITNSQMVFVQQYSTLLKELSAMFHITMSGATFGVRAVNQTTAIWNSVSSNANATVATTTYYAPPGSAKTISTTYDGGTYSAFPINFTKISDTKLKIEIKFPSLHGTNASSVLVTANDPTKAGWTSNVHACVEVKSSLPSTLQTAPPSVVLSPSTNMNSETGGAYLTLS